MTPKTFILLVPNLITPGKGIFKGWNCKKKDTKLRISQSVMFILTVSVWPCAHHDLQPVCTQPRRRIGRRHIGFWHALFSPGPLYLRQLIPPFLAYICPKVRWTLLHSCVGGFGFTSFSFKALGSFQWLVFCLFKPSPQIPPPAQIIIPPSGELLLTRRPS